MTLGGCATFSGAETTRAPLPPLPSEIVACLKKRIFVPQGNWTRVETVTFIGRIIAQDEMKIGCADRLVSFYDELRRGLQ